MSERPHRGQDAALDLPHGAEILIVRLKSLGDILLSFPFAAELKRHRPDLMIDYLIDPVFAGITTLTSAVRTEHVRPREWAGRIGLAARLRGKYHAAIDLHGSPSAALIARLASRGEVVGFEGKRLDRIYTVSVASPDPGWHTTKVNLSLLEAFGISPPENFQWDLKSPFPSLLGRFDLPPEGSAVLHAGGRFSHKLWPAAKFSTLASTLRRSGYHVVLLEGPEDSTPDELVYLPRVKGLSPPELFEFLSASRLFVGNDSGPMHFAAAAGIPTVGLFGPSDLARWSPQGRHASALSAECLCGVGSQRPCSNPSNWCMARIEESTVLAKVESLVKVHVKSERKSVQMIEKD